MPFIDPPSTGVARLREIVAAIRIPKHEFREVVTALGASRSNDALDFLKELAAQGGDGLQGLTREWIDAVAALGTPESRQVLLSFINPDLGQIDIEKHFDYHDHECLALHLLNIANSESAVKDRLYLLCARQLSPAMRSLVADVITRLGTSSALSAGIELIHDGTKPPIPYQLSQGLERLFLERRPYGKSENTYTLEPRSANEIRRRLFDMVLTDDSRMRSAWTLLGQIELWRVENGRPTSEPRHPDFDSGVPWPPIKLIRQ